MEMRHMVIVHDSQHGDAPKIVKAFASEATEGISVRSYTDLVDQDNPHNASLRDEARYADIIAIQESLLYGRGRPTATVRNALMASILTPANPSTKVGVFGDSYDVRMLDFDEFIATATLNRGSRKMNFRGGIKQGLSDFAGVPAPMSRKKVRDVIHNQGLYLSLADEQELRLTAELQRAEWRRSVARACGRLVTRKFYDALGAAIDIIDPPTRR